MIGEDTKKDGRTNGTVETFHETSLQKTRKAAATVAFLCGGIES